MPAENEYRQQLYNQMILRETDDLLEIWRENNRAEWTQTTFDVIGAILQDRLGEIPLQKEPVYQIHQPDFWERNGLQKPLGDPSESENIPVFYDPRQVIRLTKWIPWIGIAFVIVCLVGDIKGIHQISLYFAGLENTYWLLFAWFIVIPFAALLVIIQCAVVYYAVNAVSAILKILMELEFNSRRNIEES